MVLLMVSRVLAGQAEDEIAVNDQAELVAILGELAGALDGGALLDVLQNLRIAGFVADDQQAASGFLHRLQRFEVGGDARGAGPGQAQRLQLGAEFDGARLLDVEGVVVEEKFLHVGPVSLWPSPFRAPRHRWSACATDVRSASAATGRRCTAPGIRAWCRATRTDGAGTARCSGVTSRSRR